MNKTSLQTLLEQGKFDEAKKIIEDMFVSQDQETEGDMYVDFAAMYLGAMNDINARYLEALEEAVESLESVRKSEKEVVSNLKMKEVRAKLNS